MAERIATSARVRRVMAAGAGQTAARDSGSAPTLPDSEDSPCLDEVAMVRRATEVLGVEHVAHWMRSRIPSLGNQTPYALIRTPDGCGQVEQALLKIEHGVY